jgi:hypothetical protein
MADFASITSPHLARVAVPKRRGFTNPDGSPSFRLMLEHFRYERSVWRDRARRNGSGKLSAFDLGAIAADLRRCGEREEIASGWHPLRATADAFDAEADKRGLAALGAAYAAPHAAKAALPALPGAIRSSPRRAS